MCETFQNKVGSYWNALAANIKSKFTQLSKNLQICSELSRQKYLNSVLLMQSKPLEAEQKNHKYLKALNYSSRQKITWN